MSNQQDTKKKNPNVPTLRFPSFTSEWEKTRLPNVGQFLPGLTYKPDDVSENGRLVLRSCNIQNGELTLDDSLFVKESIVKPALSVRPYDVLMCIRNGSKKLVGKTALLLSYDTKLTWGAFMAIIRPNNSCSFLFHYLNSPSFRKQIFPDTNTATVNQITAGIYNRCKIFLPNQEEQQRIASLLDIFDRRISVQNKIIEDWRLLIMAISDQIFKRKLRLASISDGSFLSTTLRHVAVPITRKNDGAKHPIMMISATNGFIEQKDRYERENAGSSLKRYTLLRKNELAYNHGYSKIKTYGSTFRLERESALIPFVYHAFAIKQPNSPEYFGYYLNSRIHDRYLKTVISSSARMDGLMNITFEDFLETPILVPSPEEQAKLAVIISSLHKKLKLEIKKRESMCNLKAYLLNNLFI